MSFNRNSFSALFSFSNISYIECYLENEMEPTIIIDAGHGGTDNGAKYQGRLEKDDTLRLALAVGNILEQDGFPVVYTRTTDIYQSPIQKAMIANASGGDYFVSIHRNASENPGTYSGVQTLIYNEGGIKETLASNINQEMVALGFEDKGVPTRPNLVVLKRTKMPAVLVEAGFIDSDKDNELFDNQFDELARGIARGIEETVGSRSFDVKRYGVQVGLYRRLENAQYQATRLINQGYEAEVVEKTPYYAVIVGEENNVDGARMIEQKLRADGYDTLIVSL